MSLDLVLLRRFESVCRLRSFSRAAAELGLSHAAVTKSIQTLEEDLNARLFDRTTRAVEPTEMGLRLLARAPELLAHADDVRSAVSHSAPQLTVVCGPVVLDTFLDAGLLEFSRTHPRVHVDVRMSAMTTAIEQLSRRQADLLLFNANVAGELANLKSLRIELVLSEPIVMFFREGHPALNTDMSLQALLGFDWVAAGFGRLVKESISEEISEVLMRRGFPKYLVPSQTMCLDMVAQSDVLTYGPASAAKRLPLGSPVRSAPLPIAAQYSLTAFTRADAPPSPLAAAFVHALSKGHSQTQTDKASLKEPRRKPRVAS